MQTVSSPVPSQKRKEHIQNAQKITVMYAVRFPWIILRTTDPNMSFPCEWSVLRYPPPQTVRKPTIFWPFWAQKMPGFSDIICPFIVT